MARARKAFRELTVSEATNYGRKTAPMLRIQGLWLQELGFNIGDPVLVKCEDGKLIIMANTAMVKLKKAEQAFMEEETRKLEKRFQKEKEELRARFVPERQEDYGMVRKQEWRRDDMGTCILTGRGHEVCTRNRSWMRSTESILP